MVLVAVIVGYLLGIAPFVVPKILEIRSCKQEEKQKEVDKVTQEQILDEWLNGKQEKPETTDIEDTSGVNQEDILKEYLTGIATKGE